MNNIYTFLAKYYDDLQKEIDYKKYLHLAQNYLQPGEYIIDLGCGTGELIKLLGQNGFEVSGIDISKQMIEEAYNKLEKNKIDFNYLLCEDICKLDKLDNAAAVIMSTDTMNYITDKKDLAKLPQIINNLITEDGYLIFDIQKKKNLIYFDNYYEIKPLKEGLLHWHSNVVSQANHIVEHNFEFEQDGKIVFSEKHRQKFKSPNYYRAKFYPDFKLVDQFEDDYRFYIVIRRR